MRVQSWGRLSDEIHQTKSLYCRLETHKQLQLLPNTNEFLAYGMGRSYGDACLNSSATLLLTKGLNHLISFDAISGVLECESGVLLKDIQELMIPRGWMLAVTPGTQMITVGGAIANDVHGKNHHIHGSFGDTLLNISLLRTNGEVIECDPQNNSPWFEATLGGIGLTGIIMKAKIQLRKVQGPWLDKQTIVYNNLPEFFALCEESEKNWEYTVSWFDCLRLGQKNKKQNVRGIFMRANHHLNLDKSSPIFKSRTIPLTPPISLVNKLSLSLFNSTYFYLNKFKIAPTTAHYQPFFYPLDGINDWNKIYGPKGFYQYQFVIPREFATEALELLLQQIARYATGSFLAVLKTFGNRTSRGMLGFPQPGVTLALDFPNLDHRTHHLMNTLDLIVKESGGKIYLAKDARMSRAVFEATYPRLNEFLKYRDQGISSDMSKRLMGF